MWYMADRLELAGPTEVDGQETREIPSWYLVMTRTCLLAPYSVGRHARGLLARRDLSETGDEGEIASPISSAQENKLDAWQGCNSNREFKDGLNRGESTFARWTLPSDAGLHGRELETSQRA
jgi:hypothetical protein